MAPATERRAAQPRRAGRRRRRPPGQRRTLWAWLVVLLIVILGILGGIAFNDRHWHAFDDAGDVAFERRNYDYAERMYGQALEVARELGDDELIAATLRDLSRTYAAQGRQAEARQAAVEARRALGR